jgi:hypothetical protein
MVENLIVLTTYTAFHNYVPELPARLTKLYRAICTKLVGAVKAGIYAAGGF